MINKVYINGDIYDANDAKVSIFDRGYLFSDGVYELIPYFDSKPFLMEEHYLRLQRSLEMIELENPYNKDKWFANIEKLLKSCHFENYYLYIQVTRGMPRNFDDNILREHAATKDYQTCISMFYSKINSLKNKKTLSTKAITMEDKRWMQCDIKSVSLLYNSYAKTIAHKKGAYEAILVRDGYVTEGCSSNVFVIKDNIIYTSPESNLILPGVTRLFVINDVIKDNGYDIRLESFSEDEMLNADEIFITNSTQGILPITHVNDKLVKNNNNSNISQKLQEIFISKIS